MPQTTPIFLFRLENRAATAKQAFIFSFWGSESTAWLLNDIRAKALRLGSVRKSLCRLMYWWRWTSTSNIMMHFLSVNMCADRWYLSYTILWTRLPEEKRRGRISSGAFLTHNLGAAIPAHACIYARSHKCTHARSTTAEREEKRKNTITIPLTWRSVCIKSYCTLRNITIAAVPA